VTRRLVLLLLAGLFIAFAAYGSFVPLRLRPMTLAEGVNRFVTTPFIPIAKASGSDLVTNVLLFVPIGFFLLGGTASRSRTAALVLWLPVLVACIALSVGIEFGQVFIVGRTASWNDVFAESLGSVVGCLGWLVCGNQVVDFLAPIVSSESRTDRAFRLFGAYAALWILLGLVPFDYTMRPQEIAEKFRHGRIVLEPFGAGSTVEDVIGTWLMAIPLGVFGVLAAVHLRAPRPIATALGLGIAVAVGIEAIQVLAVSRTADVTDVAMNALGVTTGVFASSRWMGRVHDDARQEGVRLWPVAALLVWCLVVMARHWSPFDFVADGAFVRSRIPMLLRVPFYSYYWSNALDAFTEATTKALLGIPVGALLQATWTPKSREASVAQAAGITILAGGFFLIIELGQLLLPSRTPDQTDIYIGTLGAVVGMVAVRLLMRRLQAAGDVTSPSSRPAT
jgi:glycopeptide antibiotics resistance protein